MRKIDSQDLEALRSAVEEGLQMSNAALNQAGPFTRVDLLNALDHIRTKLAIAQRISVVIGGGC
jgi:hypothetical protein